MIWASQRSPRPVFAECFKDSLPRRCPRELRRPVFDECFKNLGLPEISAARFCSVSRICCPGADPAISGGPFLMSVSRIWASRRSPRPVFAECFKDLLPRRCTGDLRRPVFDECFKDLGLPEISAARFCRVFQGFAGPALPPRSPE